MKVDSKELGYLCKKLALNIDTTKWVIGTGDGGSEVGQRLSSLLGVSYARVICVKKDGYVKSTWAIASNKKIPRRTSILIVDGANYEDGEPLQSTLEQISLRYPHSKIETAALFHDPRSEFTPNYFLKKIGPSLTIEYPHQIRFID